METMGAEGDGVWKTCYSRFGGKSNVSRTLFLVPFSISLLWLLIYPFSTFRPLPTFLPLAPCHLSVKKRVKVKEQEGETSIGIRKGEKGRKRKRKWVSLFFREKQV